MSSYAVSLTWIQTSTVSDYRCGCTARRWRDPSAFRPSTSKETEIQMCDTLRDFFFLNFSPGALKYTGLTDGFLVPKCKGSSHAQSIYLPVTLLLCWESLLPLAIPAAAHSTVPRPRFTGSAKCGWRWQKSGKRKCVN